MRYPMTKNWLVFEKVSSREYLVEDCWDQKSYRVDARLAEFAIMLDGKRDPYNMGYPASRQCIREMLCELEKARFLRKHMFICEGFLSIFKTLWIPEEKEKTRRVAFLINRILLLLWLPVLALGMFFVSRADTVSSGGYFSGFFFGLLSGMVFHEFAHGAATLGYGGKLFEMGVMIRYLIPGAYVLIDVKDIKNKFHRIQVYGAGVEMNFLLAGVYFILASCIPPLYVFFYMAGINNLCLGVINLMLFFGVDGMSIAGEIMGSSNFVFNSYLLLTDKQHREAILRRGVNGMGVLLSSVLVGVGQLVLPLFILLNFLEVINVV